jgi:hypothetical protein
MHVCGYGFYRELELGWATCERHDQEFTISMQSQDGTV